MNNREELVLWRRVGHAINMACTCGNNERIRNIVGAIDSWSYAHRQGNGDITEEEQEELINNKLRRLERLLSDTI